MFSKSQQIEVSRGVEKNNVDRCNYREGVEEQSKDTRTEARSIHQLSRAIEDPGTFLIDPPASEKLSRVQELSRSIHQLSK